MKRIEAMKSIQGLLRYKNRALEERGERLWMYSELIGKKLCLSQDELIDLEVLSKLHNVGKLMIQEEVFMKATQLMDAECQVIKMDDHSGYKMMNTEQSLIHIVDLFRHNLERWDGHGYPCELSGENIPLPCRIISVVDAFDIMVGDHVYYESISTEYAIIELMEHAGTQFDPHIVDIFLQVLNDARVLVP